MLDQMNKDPESQQILEFAFMTDSELNARFEDMGIKVPQGIPPNLKTFIQEKQKATENNEDSIEKKPHSAIKGPGLEL